MPSLLESLMFWRRNPTTPDARLQERADDKRIAYKRLRESFPGDFGSYDPYDLFYDRYYANGQWFLPMGGSVPGIGGTANKVQGQYAYVFRTEQELRLQRDRARSLYATEPMAQAIVGHLRAFTVGAGFVYKVIAKKNFIDSVAETYLQEMQDELDTWMERELWTEREQELFDCQVIDGEWFLRLMEAQGELTVRRLEPEHITNPPGGSVVNGWYQGVQCEVDDVETVVGYYYRAYPHNDGDLLDADEVIHFKPGVTRNVTRGVSDFFCLADDLDSTGKLVDNCRDGAAERAGYAFIRSHKSTTPNAVDDFAARMADSQGTGSSGKVWRGKSSRGTKVVDAGENMEVTTMPTGDTDGHIAAVGMMMRVLGNRWGMPEFMVSGDASNNNYSSILVSGGPFVRQIEMKQNSLKSRYKKLMTRVLEFGARKGNYPIELLEKIEVDVQAPSPVIQDKLVEAQTYDIEARNHVISPQEWAAKLGRDPDKLQQDWNEHNDANMETQMMGQGQGIDPSFGNGGGNQDGMQEHRVREVVDDSGHAHVGKGSSKGGQFTGKGGESLPHGAEFKPFQGMTGLFVPGKKTPISVGDDEADIRSMMDRVQVDGKTGIHAVIEYHAAKIAAKPSKGNDEAAQLGYKHGDKVKKSVLGVGGTMFTVSGTVTQTAGGHHVEMDAKSSGSNPAFGVNVKTGQKSKLDSSWVLAHDYDKQMADAMPKG